MSRAKRGFKARHRRKKILNRAKGFRGARSKLYRTSIHVVRRALCYAYRDRRVRRRQFRRLWIMRINAAARAEGIKYSQFMHGLKSMNCELDRSVLADLAVTDPSAFSELATKARQAL